MRVRLVVEDVLLSPPICASRDPIGPLIGEVDTYMSREQAKGKEVDRHADKRRIEGRAGADALTMTLPKSAQSGLVSTIIPVLNRPVLVIEAVASVIAQP